VVKRTQQIVIDYIPRRWQAWFHKNKKRHNILVIHRRGGKTHGVVHDMVDEAVNFNKVDPKTKVPYKNPRYGYYATTNQQARDAAWQPLKDATKHIPGVRYNEQKMRVVFPHPAGICTIFCSGTENFDAIRGGYLDGAILDEFGDMHPDVRDKVIYAMLTDRRGWEIIIGTPKGDNNFKKMYEAKKDDPNWCTAFLTVYKTGVFDDTEIAEIKEEMSEEAFRQEYELDWSASPEGYYYEAELARLREKERITSVPYDPRYPVMTFWDLGVNDYCAIWFVQEVGREPALIDYIEDKDKGLDHYWELLQEKDYKYSSHYLPHDVEHREITSAQSRRDYLYNMGMRNIIVVPKSKSVSEDVHKVRMVLRKCVFDRVKTARGLECLAGYRKKWDSKEKVYLNKPTHNWASHGADAFRQFAVMYEPGIGKSYAEAMDTLPVEADRDYDMFDL